VKTAEGKSPVCIRSITCYHRSRRIERYEYRLRETGSPSDCFGRTKRLLRDIGLPRIVGDLIQILRIRPSWAIKRTANYGRGVVRETIFFKNAFYLSSKMKKHRLKFLINFSSVQIARGPPQVFLVKIYTFAQISRHPEHSSYLAATKMQRVGGSLSLWLL